MGKLISISLILLVVLLSAIEFTALPMPVKAQTLVGTLALPGVESGVVDSTDGFAYFGVAVVVAGIGSGSIVKVRLSDFTVVNTLPVNGPPGEAAIDVPDGFVYFMVYNATDDGSYLPNEIVKISLSNFKIVGTIEVACCIQGISVDNGFGYLAIGGGFGTSTPMVKLRLSDMTEVASINCGCYVVSVVVDPTTGFVYYGTFGFSNPVIKVRASDFTQVASLTVGWSSSVSEAPAYLGPAYLDSKNGFLYIGDYTPMFKIRLSDFTLVPNNSGCCSLATVIDSKGIAYVGYTLNLRLGLGEILEIRLSDGTTLGFLAWPDNYGYPWGTAAVDEANGFVYFGTSSGFVLKISVMPLGDAISSVYSVTATLGFEETGNVFDNAGAGFLIGHRGPPKVVFIFTDSTRVNQATGQLSFTDYSNALVVAGPLANPTTAFYESHGFTPLTFSLSGGNAIFKQSGTQVFSVPFASLTSTNDYFIVETFPGGGHTVTVLYGMNAPGTLASGVYFDSFVITNPANYPAGAYIVHWQGKVPNTPLASDTYTIVYPPLNVDVSLRADC